MARKTSKRSKKPVKPKPRKPEVTRRDAIYRMVWYGTGGAVLLGVGGAFAMDFKSKMTEGDLSRIGQGVPTIVQIHDPNCGMCRDLQRETRAALKQFEGDAVTYLVANIRSGQGAAFAAGMGLPHVTLVLFDETGKHVHTVSGVTPRSQLVQTFRRLLKL